MPIGGDVVVLPLGTKSMRSFLDVIVAAEAAGTPIPFGGNLILRHSAPEKIVALRTDIAGLADDIGMALAPGQVEGSNTLEHELAWPAWAVTLQPFEIETRFAAHWLAIRRAGDLDKRPDVNVRWQSLQNAEDSGNASFIAGEQMPIRTRIEDGAG